MNVIILSFKAKLTIYLNLIYYQSYTFTSFPSYSFLHMSHAFFYLYTFLYSFVGRKFNNEHRSGSLYFNFFLVIRIVPTFQINCWNGYAITPMITMTIDFRFVWHLIFLEQLYNYLTFFPNNTTYEAYDQTNHLTSLCHSFLTFKIRVILVLLSELCEN